LVADHGALEIADVAAIIAEPAQRIANGVLERHKTEVVLPHCVVAALVVGDECLKDVFSVVGEAAVRSVVLAIQAWPERQLVTPATFLFGIVEAIGGGDNRLWPDQGAGAAPGLALLVLHLEIANGGVGIGGRIGDRRAIVLPDDVARIGVGGVTPAAF